MRVIGLDLSIAATGIAYRDGTTRTVVTRTSDGDHRLLQIAECVHHAAGGELGPAADLAVLEDLPKNAHAAGITGMVHGVVRATLLQADVPYAVVVPATLKAYATGRGTASKTDMAMAAYKRAGAEFSDDNQCDAWWLRAAGLDRLGAPLFPLPGEQRARLEKARWPGTAPPGGTS
ncbi:Holliday junction endonuclease [Streptomyces albus subsp. albus]|nr:Holliday junction endonuclease [Streptomyces albus subsp. albus]